MPKNTKLLKFCAVTGSVSMTSDIAQAQSTVISGTEKRPMNVLFIVSINNREDENVFLKEVISIKLIDCMIR